MRPIAAVQMLVSDVLEITATDPKATLKRGAWIVRFDSHYQLNAMAIGASHAPATKITDTGLTSRSSTAERNI